MTIEIASPEFLLGLIVGIGMCLFYQNLNDNT